ncbi:D-isomer specific 2-hydroxyacid dehydrogenase family protein [Corynebacterium frankenforstense]|uniref:D-isomer specific 2-hydroxyacid dehydrogenase family protein n=1 Tax=Corynebacterium frankenforstense TaxID=1230998 RepID=UPI0026EAB7A2|nr:D-isomer specific 2-hydroxyacid dehydrogenase family protein [Corynebacterium frankenforstense]
MKFTMLPAVWPEPVAELEAAGHEYARDLDEAEFLVWSGGANGFPRLPESVGFVQYVFAGVEHLIGAGVIDGSVRWANAGGVYARPVAETALALLLSQLHQHKAAALAASFDARWDLDAAQGWLFRGPTVALVGAGGIARALMELLEPFGCRIIAVNNSGRAVPGADETLAAAEAYADGEFWSRADAVVLSAPLTGSTRGLVDAAVLRCMKDSAVLVNVGRGPLVDTDALAAALRDGEIAGAGLDVTDPEPLPDGHPLWALPNCTISPHIAATDRVARHLIGPQIVANAAAFAAGETMPTEVDVEAGY